MNSQITWLNGRFLPADEARVPVADRGFRFGDGVFETIRLVRGAPYQWNLHMARLTQGLTALRIAQPTADWLSIARELVAQNKASEGFLRIAVSRGVGSQGYMPNADIQPTCVMEFIPPSPLPTQPFTLWQSHEVRPASNYKQAQAIACTLALMEARDEGCDEALLLSRDGMVSETASANLFWLKDDQLFTPALATGCVAGTTRATILQLGRVNEIVTHASTLADAQAVFIANVRLGIWPVTSIAPHMWRYDAQHPRIAELQQKLNETRQSAAWPA